MINDYVENSLVWLYFNHKMIGNEKVFSYNFLQGKWFFVTEFKRKGIKLTDVTPSYFIEISYSHIENLDPIEIYLDN